MQYIRYSDAVAKVERELDMQDDSFVEDDEMMGYFNDAIDDAESAITKIYEDYFLKRYAVPMVTGQSAIAMPTDIYADKIRIIVFNDGSRSYQVERIKLKDISGVTAASDYMFNIEHETAGQVPALILYPPARDTSSSLITMWYVRNANRITAQTDYIDIPEFITYIYAHVKCNCMVKERNPGLPLQIEERDRLRAEMITTLQTRILDGSSNEIEADFSHYEEHE